MKKRKTVVIIVAILLGIFLLVENSKRREKELIREELQKPEVIAVIEETLNNLEKNLSNKDVIKSYEIDYDETHLNASGNGIETKVFVNGNRDLKIGLLISKNKDKYRVGVAVVSKELADYVEAEEQRSQEQLFLILKTSIKPSEPSSNAGFFFAFAYSKSCGGAV